MALASRDGRPPTWSKNRRGNIPAYKYVSVKELQDNAVSLVNCNVYGVVTDFKNPAKSKGSDYFALIFIIDDTDQRPLRIRLFHRDPEYFPKVDNGDIIRIHRLKVYNENVNLSLVSTKGWAWLHWSFKDIENPVAEPKASSTSYTLLPRDNQIVEKLKEWQRDNTSAVHAKNRNFKRFSEIKQGNHICVICKVIKFKQISDDFIVAKVWDGTIPTEKFYQFEEMEHRQIQTDIPNDYVVDVAIYQDHAKKWIEIGIVEGHYILLWDLHAWANTHNPLNNPNITCSELSLHDGAARGRGIEIAPDDDRLDIIKSDIAEARRKAMDDQQNWSQAQSISGNVPDETVSEAANSQGPCSKKAKLLDNGNVQQEHSGKNELLSSVASDSTTLGDNIVAEDLHSTMRCLQESITVVTGEGTPLRISPLQTVIDCEVPLHTSKFFLFRGRVRACETHQDAFAGHYSITTGIFFPSSNDGAPLECTAEVKRFVDIWREVRGHGQATSTAVDVPDSLPLSQWVMPSREGETTSVGIKNYECTSDGSKWQSMEAEDHITRKRKLGDSRFTIVYLLKNNHYSPEILKKLGAKYDRVIRSVSQSVLASEEPPAVAIQNDVFYYSCPANAVHPAVPSLSEEAEHFVQHRVTEAMGSPALVPRFNFSFVLADDSATLRNALLTGKNAVKFFCDTTPQQYLANKDGEIAFVRTCIDKLLDESSVLECVLEKRSRKRYGDDPTPEYIYHICNATLKVSPPFP